MNKENPLIRLQAWYKAQCNGDWEHLYGIKIDTLDNPGWTICIDLNETEYEDKKFKEIDRQTSENDWCQCEVKNNKFYGAGGPDNLSEALTFFLDWIEK